MLGRAASLDVMSMTKEETRSICHSQLNSSLTPGKGHTNKGIGGRGKKLRRMALAQALGILGVRISYRERSCRYGSVHLDYEQAEVGQE